MMASSQLREAISVDYLSHHPALVPVIASWVYGYWGMMYQMKSIEDQIERLSERLNTDRFPLALVAHVGSTPVGTASLKIHEMTTHESYYHWLGTVYVALEVRNQGVGSLLINCAETKSRELGVQTLYLHTPDKETFYLNQGWEVVERPTYFDMQVALMRKRLAD